MNNIKLVKRHKCVISDSDLEFLSQDKFPLFCGCVNSDDQDDYICDQNWTISKEGVIQLQNLIPLDLLYANGHDAGSVGALWEEHHKEFANFVIKTNPKSVLEIGGGHGKLSQNCLGIKNIKWTIVEPNTENKYENVDYIDGFFHKEIFNDRYFDTIVHSHTFEHIYNPHEFLEEISSVLMGGGRMIFSLPNMKKWLENKFTNCLNFEHTIFLTENVLEFLLQKHRFRVLEKQYFKEHSIFYHVCKDESIDTLKVVLKNEYDENKKLFLDMKKYYQEKIFSLNQILETTNKKIYLFGAHLFSQYLIYNGLKIDKIISILDNNPNKQEKRLYGTNFKVKSPKILKEQDDSLVILNAGVYNDEIRKDIINNINKNVEIIGF
ncbi:class I SAM-dependent methyltransferase [Campylobacter molothri]|uniref:class I SAM-dependent methyltransferase n=1 Tax=Campylobacter molothri TaxID=1032242 RepID=UPI003DA020CA